MDVGRGPWGPRGPPKRPLRTRTAFAFYVRENFKVQKAILKAEKLTVGPPEILAALAKEWKKLDESVKEDYKDLELEDKERYMDERRKWLRNFPDGKPLMKRRQKKREGFPTRNKNSFLMFQESVWRSVRLDNPTYTQPQTVQGIAKIWKGMDPKQRAPFVEKAKQDKERYAREKVRYKKEIKEKAAELRIQRLQRDLDARMGSSTGREVNQG